MNNKKAEIIVELQKTNTNLSQTINQLENIQRRTQLHKESVHNSVVGSRLPGGASKSLLNDPVNSDRQSMKNFTQTLIESRDNLDSQFNVVDNDGIVCKRKTIDVKTGRQIDDSDHSSEDRDQVGDVQVLSYIEASEQTRQSHSYLNFSTG